MDGPRDERRIEKTIGGIVLLLLASGCLLVILPFMGAIAWAVVQSFTAWPVYKRVLAWTGGRRTLASLIMTIGTALVLIVPLLVIGATFADNAKGLGEGVRQWMESPPQPPPWVSRIPLVGERVATYWRSVAVDSKRLFADLRQFVEPLIALLLAGGLTLTRGILQLTLSVLIAFFFYRDGEWAAEQVKGAISRFSGERGTRLLDVAGNTVRGVVWGILGTALVQAIMAGLGFLIAGVPGWAILGLLTFFLAILPMGPPLIWIPVALWLFHRGSTGWGIFMLIWGVGVSSVDNFVKPWLISKGSAMPFILIFIGVIGGALAFGFIGVFLGPTLLAVCYRMLQEWIKPVPAQTLPTPAPAAVPLTTPPER